MDFDINKFDVEKYDSILARGLSFGLGLASSQVCIEAAICQTLGLPHGDDPKCVAKSVRTFKIKLNDSRWSSPMARAKGMRDLGLAQLGSLGVVEDNQFRLSVVKKTIQRVIPALYRDLFPSKPGVLAVALVCEREGTRESVLEIRKYAGAYAADAGAAAGAAYAAGDKYLFISASLALETLRELNSPGIALLSTTKS